MKKRYIIYLCVLGLIALTFVAPPVLPVIQLPGEILVGGIPVIGGLTNTFVATIITFIILIANMWGLGSGEWKGVSKKARLLLLLGVATMIVAVLVVGYGNYLKE